MPEPVPVASTVDEPPARRWWLASPPTSSDEVEDTSESTSLLQQVAATTDEAFGARRAAAARDDQLLLLRAQRDRAMEEVRVAERAWRDLAGDDPVEDVEAVVRRFDPQHQDALEVAQETVGRAGRVHAARPRAGAVDRGLAVLGFDEPVVEPDAMGAVVAARRHRRRARRGRGGPRRGHREAAPAAPVLAVEAG